MKLKDFKRERLTLKLPVRMDTIYRPDHQEVLPNTERYEFDILVIRDGKTMMCRIDPKSLPGYAFTPRTKRMLSGLVGKATCHTDDKFDEALGYKMAHAKLLSLIYGLFGKLVIDQTDKFIAAKIALNERLEKMATHRAVLSLKVKSAAKKPAAKKPAAKKPIAKKPAAKKPAAKKPK